MNTGYLIKERMKDNESPHILLVVPIFNEEKVLEQSINSIVNFLDTETNYNYTVLIADNQSTDQSPIIGAYLSENYSKVEYVRIPRKGRGLALHTVWKETDAEILVYVDVDLSSPLEYLPDIIDPIIFDETDVSFGSRLLKPGKAIERSLKREITSRGYNFLLQFVLDAKFKDAQCGFKAIKKTVFDEIEPELVNEKWFFDSEVLILSQYKGYRLKEVPIIWTDDPDSKVKMASTVVDNVKNVIRVYKKHFPNSLFTKLFLFGFIGVLSTLGHALLFALLRLIMPAQFSNFLALLVMTVLNTVANKKFSFRDNNKMSALNMVLINVVSFVIFWFTTGGSLWMLHDVFLVEEDIPLESSIVIVSSLVGTVLKFGLFAFIFRKKEGKNDVNLKKA